MKNEKFQKIGDVLRITAIDGPKVSKDGRQFKTLTFEALEKFGDEVISTNVSSGRNVWEHGPAQQGSDGEMMRDKDGNIVFSKGDPLYASAKVGNLVAGNIFKAYVAKREINGRQVDTHKSVVWPHELPEQYFRRQGYEVMDGPQLALDEIGSTNMNKGAAIQGRDLEIEGVQKTKDYATPAKGKGGNDRGDEE